MDTKICSKCHKELPVSNFHKNGFNRQNNPKYRGYCKDCANQIERDRYKKKKSFAEAQKQCCIKCGETRPYVLDFHHIEKINKDFTVGKMKKGSLNVIQKEINKCVALCSNCHREFHYLERNKGITLDEYLL